MAWALELVLRSVPRYHTPKMGANGVDAVVLQRVVFLYNEIRGITLS